MSDIVELNYGISYCQPNKSQLFVYFDNEQYEFCIEQLKHAVKYKNVCLHDFLITFNNLWGYDVSNTTDVIELSILYNFVKVYN